MNRPPEPTLAAFRRLQGALVRGRLRRIEPRLRLELVALALLFDGYVFWQTRVPFNGLVRAQGPKGVALSIGATWLGLAVLGAGFAGARLSRRLRERPHEPPWLALPIPPTALTRHLAWDARQWAWWAALPAPAVLAAAIGYVPPWWLFLFAGALVVLVLETSRLGCGIAYRVAVLRARPRPGVAPLTRVLEDVAHEPALARPRRARWRTAPTWRALWSKDLALSTRPNVAAQRAALALALGVLSWIAWRLPMETALGRFVAFALALVAATSVASWWIALSGRDPFGVLRALPVGVGDLWVSRAAPAAVIAVVLALGHLVAARGLAPAPLHLFVWWTAIASFAISLLAIHYGITLFPHEDHAQRMLSISLALAMTASFIIPLLGWVLLLTAVLHSARRLGRWPRLEP